MVLRDIVKLSIIICVFNEIRTIKKLLNKVENVKLLEEIQKEIIIIDNNSADGSKEFLKKIKITKNLKIFFQEKNLGKGNSILKGIKESSGDLIIFQDADLEYDPENYNKLINHLIKNDLDAVFGSRIKNNETYFYYKINRYAVVFLTKLINLLYKGSFTDVATNHKLIKSNVLKKLNLTSKGFDLDFEISLKLAKYKYNYDEVHIDYHPRTYNEGKKINFFDAIKSLIVILFYFFKR